MASHFLPRLGEVELLEHLIETLDLAPGLLEMQLEGLPQLGGFRRLGHLRQRLGDLPLGVIDIA